METACEACRTVGLQGCGEYRYEGPDGCRPITCRSVHVVRNVAYLCVRRHDDPDAQRYHATADGQTWWVGHERIDWVRTYHDPWNPRPSYMTGGATR